jgi:hypothetical protein
LVASKASRSATLALPVGGPDVVGFAIAASHAPAIQQPDLLDGPFYGWPGAKIPPVVALSGEVRVRALP